MALDRVTQWDRWLHGAKAGSSIIYHEGYLSQDKSHTVYFAGGSLHTPRGETDVIAATAWIAYLNGRVELVQRKCGEAHYQYLAVKRAQQRPVRWIGGRYD